MDQVTRSLKLIGELVPLPIGKNKHYSQDQAYQLLFIMSAMHWFFEGPSNYFASLFPGLLPQADTVLLRLKKIPFEQVQQGFDSLIEHHVKLARQLNFLSGKVWIAIDGHDREFYGEPNSFTRGSKFKNGTSTFYSYMTASVVKDACRLVIAQLPYLPLDEPTQTTEKLLAVCSKHVHVGLLLLDRGFYSSTIVRMLKNKGLTYIMPAVKHKNIEKIIAGIRKFPCEMNLMLKDEPVRLVFVQVLDKENKPKVLVFCTNLEIIPEKLTVYYASRWGIETGYRCIEDFAAKTCSTHPTVRLFLFYFAVALFNAWVMVNIQTMEREHVTVIFIRLHILMNVLATAMNAWPPPA